MKQSLLKKVEDIIDYLKYNDQTIEVRGAIFAAEKFKNSLGVLDEKYLKVVLEPGEPSYVESGIVSESRKKELEDALEKAKEIKVVEPEVVKEEVKKEEVKETKTKK